MQAKTHMNSSIFLGLLPFAIAPILMLSILPLSILPFYIISIAIGSVLPDIDEPNSFISRKLYGFLFSLLIAAIGVFYFLKNIYVSYFILGALCLIIILIFLNSLTHRGITHKLIFPVAIVFLSIFFFEYIGFQMFLLSLGLALGIFFHHLGDFLIGDSYFKGGINNYFFPFGEAESRVQLFPKILRGVIGGFKEKIYFFIFSILIFLEFLVIGSNTIK